MKLKENTLLSLKMEIKDLEQQLLITKLDVAQSKVLLDVLIEHV